MAESQVDQTWVSLSAIELYRECPQAYSYSYIDKLRPQVEKFELDRGRVIHDYYDRYYSNFVKDEGANLAPDDAHIEALKQTLAVYAEPNALSLAVAVKMGDLKTAAQLEALPGYLSRMTERYYALRGKQDIERYQILKVEYPIKMFLVTDLSIVTSGKIDLVTFDRETGHTGIWEHKNHADIPDERRRMVNLQTLLYAVQMEAQEAYAGNAFKIDSIWWNYVKTVEPTGADGNVDALFNKASTKYPNGYPSRDQGIKTTWAIWAKAMTEHGLDPSSELWAQVRGAVLHDELDQWFPRHEQTLVASPQILLDDYIKDSRRLQQDRRDWENGKSKPSRWISWRCPRCRYYKVCTTVACGGDEDDAISTNGFIRPAGTSQSPAPSVSGAEGVA